MWAMWMQDAGQMMVVVGCEVQLALALNSGAETLTTSDRIVTVIKHWHYRSSSTVLFKSSFVSPGLGHL